MLVLSKKRISLILSCVLIAVFTFMLSKENATEQVVETVSLPVSGKTVIVDAGHGVPDEGVRLLH